MLAIFVATFGFLVTLVSAETFYVIPNNDTACPTADGTQFNENPTCLTLTQYAQLWLEPSPPSTVNSSVTTIFAPGQHTLDSRLQIQSVSGLVLQAEQTSSLTTIVLEPAVTISCTNSTGFTLQNIPEVAFSGLAFNDCRENSVRSVDRLLIEDCTFQNGHGIRMNAVTNVTIERSSFISLTAFTILSFINRESGGAIYALDSNLLIKECTFEQNSANGNGGAIFTESDSITIQGSTFDSNRASNDGGAIGIIGNRIDILHGNSFTNNTAIGNGGVVIISGTGSDPSSRIITIQSCNFSGNTAEFGGVILTFSGFITISDSVFSGNTAQISGGVINGFTVFTDIHNSDLMNNRALQNGGAILTTSGSISIYDSSVSNNTANSDGGAIHSDSANITIQNSNFSSNVADNGGAVYSSDNSISVNGSNFSGNSADDNGGVIYTSSGTINIHGSNFKSNSAEEDGGAIRTSSGTIQIRDSYFSNNLANRDGGAIQSSSGITNILDSNFRSNSAEDDGGALQTSRGSIEINNSNFSNNSAVDDGGAIRTSSGSINVRDSNFSSNSAEVDGGAIRASSGSIDIRDSNFSGNSAVDDGGAIRTSRGSINIHDSSFCSNLADGDGGAIRSLSGPIDIRDSNFSSNSADNDGGAIAVIRESDSVDIFDTNFSNNTAGNNGGAISTLANTCNIQFSEFSSNIADSGGAIWTSSDTISINNCSFVSNAANNGSALYFENSGNVMNSITDTSFNKNHAADRGGAIFSDQSTNLDFNGFIEFTNNSATTGIVYTQQSTLSFSANVTFSDNKASFYASESTITFVGNVNFVNNSHGLQNDTLVEGGAVTVLQSDLELIGTIVMMNNSVIDGFGGAIFSSESTIHFTGDTSITQNRALSGGGMYANNSELNINGRRFVFSNNSAVDQGDAMFVQSTILNFDGLFQITRMLEVAEGEYIQDTSRNCSMLNFTITSPDDSKEQLLYLEGQCELESSVDSIVDNECPVGFVRNVQQSDYSCECDPCLYLQYVLDCSVSNASVLIRDDVWISFVNEIDDTNRNECQYLTFPNCPFDYCSSANSPDPVWINLNASTGPDAQCAFNRTGKLCGSCDNGLSLSLGGSRCLQCSNEWLALLIVFAVAGVALVAFLLFCNLTVAVGTINGLIFYANILAISRTTFLPFQTPNFFTVFIAWINLDFGFVTCFFDGMDSYDREWLQLVFPIYILILTTILIIVYKLSAKVAVLFNRTDPVATLATVILLTYIKYLRIVMAAFSFATLEYPDGSRETVWLIDGTVPYLEGKHIALFVIALLILVIGIAYACLVLCYPWFFSHCPNKRVMKNNKFMEAYFTPYTPKYRYWTGLLLLIRAFLYLFAALSASSGPEGSLLAIVFTLLCLLLLRILLPGRIYKSWPLDALETSFIFNLVFFTVGSLYIRESGRGNQVALAYTSTTIAFITFLLILIYHTYAFVLPEKARSKINSLFINRLPWLKKENGKPEPETEAAATSEKVPVEETEMEKLGQQKETV